MSGEPSIFGSVIGAAGHIASTAVNYFNQKRLNRQAQDDLRENTLFNYQLSQQAQRNAARNSVAGLKAAGISPALAGGGSFSAPAFSGSSSQGSAAPPLQLDLVEPLVKMLDAFSNRMNAESNEKNAAVNQQNANVNQQNANVNQQNANTNAANSATSAKLAESSIAKQQAETKTINARRDAELANLEQQTLNLMARYDLDSQQYKRNNSRDENANAMVRQYFEALLKSGSDSEKILAKKVLGEKGKERWFTADEMRDIQDYMQAKSLLATAAAQRNMTDAQRESLQNNDIATLLDSGEWEKAVTKGGTAMLGMIAKVLFKLILQ